MTSPEKTAWRLRGDAITGCNCDWGCPCQFNAPPTRGRCEGISGNQVREGFYGPLRLDGVRFVELFWFPGAVHEGNGSQQLIVDGGATQQQIEALQAITSGDAGGMPFEVYAAVTPNKLAPLVARISFECDRDKRKARLRVDGLAELLAEPIRNPVTGEEHRARIVLPEGFEFQEAEMANAASLRARLPAPLSFEHSGTYAQLNEFDWSNG